MSAASAVGVLIADAAGVEPAGVEHEGAEEAEQEVGYEVSVPG